MPEDPTNSIGTPASSSNCWAACLGGCSNKISREHTITRSMFLDNEITVRGDAVVLWRISRVRRGRHLHQQMTALGWDVGGYCVIRRATMLKVVPVQNNKPLMRTE